MAAPEIRLSESIASEIRAALENIRIDSEQPFTPALASQVGEEVAKHVSVAIEAELSKLQSNSLFASGGQHEQALTNMRSMFRVNGQATTVDVQPTIVVTRETMDVNIKVAAAD